MSLTNLILVLTLFAIYAAGNDLNCSDLPWPVVVKFGFFNAPLSLGSTSRVASEREGLPVGYGLQLTLGGERFNPRVEISDSPEILVPEVRVTCNSTRPKECYPDASYPPNMEILAGGVYSNHQIPDSSNTTLRIQSANDNKIATNETLMIGGRVLDDFTFQANIDQLSNATRGLKNLVSSYIGLGVGSTLLERLYADGTIASRAWSFFPGWISSGELAAAIHDGSLIIGGYDASLIINSTFHEYPISPTHDKDCLFPIQVSKVMWLGTDAINASAEAGAFVACIDPGKNRFEFPMGVWENLWQRNWDTGLHGVQNVSDNWDVVNPILPLDEEGIDYNSLSENQDHALGTSGSRQIDLSMTLHLQNGLEINIPTNRLFQRKHKFSSETPPRFQSYYNLTKRTDNPRTAVLTFSSKITNRKPVFGLPFLSSTYFMADYDSETFKLAPLNIPDRSIARSVKSILPPKCLPPARDRTAGARVLAPAITVPVFIVGALAMMGVWRVWKGGSVLPLVGGKGMVSRDSVQEMDATGPFEHEIDSRQIYEMPAGDEGFPARFEEGGVMVKEKVEVDPQLP
ncbi:hypothetical protein TWF730_007059 [Orbilia blumenaviensis]|uniref:Peptidase A1 domain-containing protein n=1 Tax=Orbilia blumenaviensis TaxID=1796055 RepID=A0AAV9VIN0_9PEZI